MRSFRTRLRLLSGAGCLGAWTAFRCLVVAGWYVHVRRKDLSPWLSTENQEPDGQSISLPSPFPKAAAQYVDIVSRHPFRWAGCLQRSLALCLWLESQGYRPTLRIGVRKQGDKLLAHAWVEQGGAIINETADVEEKFVTLTPLAHVQARPRVQREGELR